MDGASTFSFAGLIVGLLILIVGGVAARFARVMLRQILIGRRMEPTAVGFLSSLAYWGLMLLVALVAMSQAGIKTTTFVAVFAAAGFAVGMALSGSLSNLAAGVMLMIFKPFRVGDYVEGGGAAGIVDDLQIFCTVLKSPDNKMVIVPNSAMAGGNITNYSAHPTRRVDLTIGVAYDADLQKVRAAIADVLGKDERILAEPEPTVAVGALGESSVDFLVRPWVEAGDYWAVYWSLLETIKTRFDAEGIGIPFPQRDVHLYQMDSPKKGK
jgi:small conductance mechanosensitive channel